MAVTEGLHILSAAKVRAESIIASVEAPPPPLLLRRLSYGLTEQLEILSGLRHIPSGDAPGLCLGDLDEPLLTAVETVS